MRRDEEHILRKVLRMDVPGKRKKKRPKIRWKDTCKRDLKSIERRVGKETDRATWSRKIVRGKEEENEVTTMHLRLGRFRVKVMVMVRVSMVL